ncbi:sirohydrochlorin chelatase [Bacillus massiliglaciei]|uniref:sirohydrochlorin chelatase n=1 Tax=Bacillus massiliglaciei TaxID=1816693 RepID=UPI000ABE37E3|nr:sirohydrochlorin chelatase [Bacillus massiliglaciei]
MDAILYICHGSRVPEAVKQAEEFINRCKQREEAAIQETCFLELSQPTIEEAFQSCIEQGATRIFALPILLLTAAHAKHDIPEELTRIHQKHPNIELCYGRPIGVHPFMVDILTEKIQESKEKISDDSKILLVGRGSSDPDVKRDLREIGDLLEDRLQGIKVQDCYLTAAEPSFEAALQQSQSEKEEKIFVLPYLLFTGILMKSMQKTIDQFSKSSEKQFILCSYLGYHPKIESVLHDRLSELNGVSERVSNNA